MDIHPTLARHHAPVEIGVFSWRNEPIPSVHDNIAEIAFRLASRYMQVGFAHAVQSATTSPGTRRNSRLLAVTSVALRQRACAAMR
jgi:hypothetical protein